MAYTSVLDREEIYEIISRGLKEGVISGEEAFRMILVKAPSYYTRLSCPKNVGEIRYSSEVEGLIRELDIPYETEESKIIIYSNDFARNAYEFLLRGEDPKSLTERKIMEGFPSCCARAYVSCELEGKPHRFFEEISEAIRGKCKNLRDFTELIEEGEIYPLELLYRDDLTPHEINCKLALQASAERATLAKIAETKIGNIGLLGFGKEVEKSRILKDYLTVLESIGYLSTSGSLRKASKIDERILKKDKEMRN